MLGPDELDVIFLAENQQYAQSYSRLQRTDPTLSGDFRSGRVYDMDLNTDNILEHPTAGHSDDLTPEDFRRLMDEGYDGVHFDSADPEINEYVVWSDDAIRVRGVAEEGGYQNFDDRAAVTAGLQGLDESPDQTFVASGTSAISESSQHIAGRQHLQNTQRWTETRTNALAEANIQRVQDFPDYDNASMVSSIMKMVYPFWGYESHRWAWYLPREALRHPGVAMAWGRYSENTDLGYINLPGPLDVNLLRGTIAMGGLRRLMTRDYPEYYDNFEGFSEYLDYGSRFGFYPGSPIGLLLAGFGASAGGPQLGELVPPAGRTLQGALAAIAPNNPAVQLLNETIFPDRFRSYLIANQVSRDSINAAIGEGDLEELLRAQRAGTLAPGDAAVLASAVSSVNGAELWLKQIDNIPLTEEEQAAWNRGSRGIGKWQALMEQTGIFRFNPDERRIVRAASYEIVEELTGVPPSILEDMRRYGIRWEDVWGARSPELKQALNALEIYGHFSAGIGLLPSSQGVAQARIRGFWETIGTNNDQFRSDLLITEKEFEQGNVSFRTWDRSRRDKVSSLTGSIDELKNAPQFANVPVTIDERLSFAEEDRCQSHLPSSRRTPLSLLRNRTRGLL